MSTYIYYPRSPYFCGKWLNLLIHLYVQIKPNNKQTVAKTLTGMLKNCTAAEHYTYWPAVTRLSWGWASYKADDGTGCSDRRRLALLTSWSATWRPTMTSSVVTSQRCCCCFVLIRNERGIAVGLYTRWSLGAKSISVLKLWSAV